MCICWVVVSFHFYFLLASEIFFALRSDVVWSKICSMMFIRCNFILFFPLLPSMAICSLSLSPLHQFHGYFLSIRFFRLLLHVDGAIAGSSCGHQFLELLLFFCRLFYDYYYFQYTYINHGFLFSERIGRVVRMHLFDRIFECNFHTVDVRCVCLTRHGLFRIFC